MVSGDAPAKAENVFSNIFLFKKWVSVWRNARMAGGKAKGGGTGMGTRCRACMAGGSGTPVPGAGGGSPSWHRVAESAFPNLLVFLSHGWKNQGQRRAACLQTWLPGKLVKGH